jgi:acyl-coenzyme A synthetase/AMP-(fatty) acid ligase
MGYIIDESDKFLQSLYLTFVYSLVFYIAPLLKGASVYTIPHDQVKYSYIAKLLTEHELTFIELVPSAIRYLRAYFDEINLPKVKYSMFAGEALPLDLAAEWSRCVPNASIINMYGATENTCIISHYRFIREGSNKSYNGNLPVGKPGRNTEIIVVDDNNTEVGENAKGVLCLAGKQLTPGYWKNPGENKRAFFMHNNTRFYRTGDMGYKDADGDVFYCGRSDQQVKVQGYRVELNEIEHNARVFLGEHNVACVTFTNAIGNTEIGLFIEAADYDPALLLGYLKTKLPPYMIPGKVLCCPQFPLNANGKIDKITLKGMVHDYGTK